MPEEFWRKRMNQIKIKVFKKSLMIKFECWLFYRAALRWKPSQNKSVALFNCSPGARDKIEMKHQVYPFWLRCARMVYFLNDEQLWIPYCVNDKTKKKDCIELEKVCPFLGVLSGHLLLGAFMCQSCASHHMRVHFYHIKNNTSIRWASQILWGSKIYI